MPQTYRTGLEGVCGGGGQGVGHGCAHWPEKKPSRPSQAVRHFPQIKKVRKKLKVCLLYLWPLLSVYLLVPDNHRLRIMIKIAMLGEPMNFLRLQEHG